MAAELVVLSLRYSSWSIRPWLALTHAGLDFTTRTVDVELRSGEPGAVDPFREEAAARRAEGSVTGLFPVLHVDGTAIHEGLAISEYAAEVKPEAGLWPEDQLLRARARGFALEMATGFFHLRNQLSCHVFARVPNFEPDAACKAEIARVFEIWDSCLQRSGGPFLFGGFGIVDCMYFPVVTRFATYGVELPPRLAAYAEAMWSSPAVRAWRELAVVGPRIPMYDEMIVNMGGDPDAALKA